MRLTEDIPQVDIPPLPPEPTLAWLDGLSDGGALPSLTHPVPARRIRFTQSATELMARGRSREEWRLKYHHGVIPCWYFARDGAGQGDGGGGLGARTRGIVIHGVLERIQEEEELAELLDVVIGTLDAPELEEHMAPGSKYRRQLEQEIRGVVSSDEWRWYVEGEHYRELDFVQFRTPEKWRIGAFDLYRPADPDRPDRRLQDPGRDGGGGRAGGAEVSGAGGDVSGGGGGVRAGAGGGDAVSFYAAECGG